MFQNTPLWLRWHFIKPTSKHPPLVTAGVSEAQQRFESGARKGFPIIPHKQTSPLQVWASNPLWGWRRHRPGCEPEIDAQLIPHLSSICVNWQKNKDPIRSSSWPLDCCGCTCQDFNRTILLLQSVRHFGTKGKWDKVFQPASGTETLLVLSFFYSPRSVIPHSPLWYIWCWCHRRSSHLAGLGGCQEGWMRVQRCVLLGR